MMHRTLVASHEGQTRRIELYRFVILTEPVQTIWYAFFDWVKVTPSHPNRWRLYDNKPTTFATDRGAYSRFDQMKRWIKENDESS